MNRRKLITAGLGFVGARKLITSAHAQAIGESFWKKAPVQTPSTIFGANLFAWYKADTGVTGGANVTGWADQSGNGFNMTQVNQNGTAQTTPTFSATGFNTSFPGISFTNGSTQGLTSSAANLNSNQFAFFGVINANPNVGWAYYDPATENSIATNNGALVLDTSDATHFNFLYNGGGATSGTSPMASGNNYRVGTIWDNSQVGVSSIVLYTNNVAGALSGTTVSTFGISTSAIVIGAIYTGGAVTSAGFVITELVVVKGTLTSGQRASLDTYFRTKWGL